MYNHSTIKSSLYGLVGFKQDARTEFGILDEGNIGSTSGMYFNDYHSLINTEILKNIAPEDLTDAQFNDWLEDLTKASITKTVNSILSKFRMQNSSALWENTRLYSFANVFDTKLTYVGNAFVGYEIELCHSDNIMIVLNAIGLQFDADDTFNLYVFHSSQKNPIYTIEVTPSANNEQWEAQTAKYLEHITDTYAGGKFYIGYLQQDVTANAINREWDFANLQSYSRFFSVQPIKVNDHASATLFDIADVEYTSDTYGLNFDLTVQTNLTKQIVKQANLLTNVIGYGVAVDILERIANSTRGNAVKKETRDLAFNELNIESGLKKKFADELKAVHLDFAGIDDLTMKKRKRIHNMTGR